MPAGSKITFEQFQAIKAELIFGAVDDVANSRGVDISTVRKIKSADNWQDYAKLKADTHKPVQFSMRDKLFEIAESQKRIEELLQDALRLKQRELL